MNDIAATKPAHERKCTCEFCNLCERVRGVIAERDVEKLTALVNELMNNLCNVGEENSYLNCRHEEIRAARRNWENAALELANRIRVGEPDAGFDDVTPVRREGQWAGWPI